MLIFLVLRLFLIGLQVIGYSGWWVSSGSDRIGFKFERIRRVSQIISNFVTSQILASTIIIKKSYCRTHNRWKEHISLSKMYMQKKKLNFFHVIRI
jgi:hypothetical protein